MLGYPTGIPGCMLPSCPSAKRSLGPDKHIQKRSTSLDEEKRETFAGAKAEKEKKSTKSDEAKRQTLAGLPLPVKRLLGLPLPGTDDIAVPGLVPGLLGGLLGGVVLPGGDDEEKRSVIAGLPIKSEVDKRAHLAGLPLPIKTETEKREAVKKETEVRYLLSVVSFSFILQ